LNEARKEAPALSLRLPLLLVDGLYAPSDFQNLCPEGLQSRLQRLLALFARSSPLFEPLLIGFSRGIHGARSVRNAPIKEKNYLIGVYPIPELIPWAKVRLTRAPMARWAELGETPSSAGETPTLPRTRRSVRCLSARFWKTV
jgi:hypothetical protein